LAVSSSSVSSKIGSKLLDLSLSTDFFSIVNEKFNVYLNIENGT
jgi:hypothetical protein